MTHDEGQGPEASQAIDSGLASTIEYWATQSASIRPRRDHWEAHPVVKSTMIERRGANGPGDWLARRLPRVPLRALSLGAGAGLFELDLVRRGVVTSFDLMDVTPQLMQSASEQAAADGFGDRVRCLTADINRVELEPASYDLVTFVSALHHVENLEHVLEQCRRAIRPGGFFFINEYVGPNRFAFPAEHVSLARAMYRTIDPRLRISLPDLPSPDPRDVVAADPTEAIRSQEILEIVPRYFPAVQVLSLDVCLTLILWYGLNHDALHDTDEGHTLVRWLLDVDRSLVRSGRLPTYHADVLARIPAPRVDLDLRSKVAVAGASGRSRRRSEPGYPVSRSRASSRLDRGAGVAAARAPARMPASAPRQPDERSIRSHRRAQRRVRAGGGCASQPRRRRTVREIGA